MKQSRQLLLGVFFLVALSILAFYTLFLTDVQFLGDPILHRVYFPEAYGLREGDPVQVSGLRIGRVTRLSFHLDAPPEKRILAEIRLDQPVELFEGARILIAETTLLGGRHVEIEPGKWGGKPLETDPDGALYGGVRYNPIQALGEVGNILSENSDAVASILSNVDGLMSGVRSGKGLVGRLLSDETLADDVGKTVGNLRSATDQLARGEGLLGSLLYDQALSESVRKTLTDLQQIAVDVRGGRGVVGGLIYDDELADEIRAAVRSFSALGGKIERGEGVLGKLLGDPALEAQLDTIVGNIAAASDDLQVVLGQVRGGEGSLGKLMMNEELYTETLRSVKLLTRTLEDYREAAPITAFTGVLFSAF